MNLTLHAATLAFLTSTAGAAPVSFEGYPPSNVNQGDYYASMTEAGFVLTRGNGWLVSISDTATNIPDSGSIAVLVEGGNNASFTLAAELGGMFDLQSFRGSEGRNIQSGNFADYASSGLRVIGYFAAGGSISTDFNFDLIAGNNSATDFQFFSLLGYSGLSSVEFVAYGNAAGPRPYSYGHSFGIDDINVNLFGASSTVPVPGTLPLVATVLACLWIRSVRRSSSLKSEFEKSNALPRAKGEA